ncbi:hypothetical protein BGZ63DRAFT_397824 [Mariannaea sp. PMI_226]|nr:hypothetical protein BGZ63DRAFT_397824 [Mariannaea sp. PMI_226]
MEHRALNTRCFDHGCEMGFGKHSWVFQVSSYNFDGCIMDILTTLLHGACGCIPN